MHRLIIIGFTVLNSICLAQNQTSQTPNKFGSLAIDRSNGFYYGWSSDQPSRQSAEQRAIAECKKAGGICAVVLTYSGAGCASYRTVDSQGGTAYGWGVAKTKEEADETAMRECLSRSNGKVPGNFVWSCNAGSAKLKEIYNASAELMPTIRIGDQEWSAVDLNVTKFRNGDPIPLINIREEFIKAGEAGKPAYSIVNSRIIYNGHAMSDPRGLAPKGFHIPSHEEWDVLLATLGGKEVAGAKLMSTEEWPKDGKGTNESGFNGLPGGGRGIANGFEPGTDTHQGAWWSATKNTKGYFYLYDLYYDRASVYITAHGPTWGYSVRLIKD